MFEITGDDIALLNDEQLRELIGRLCETEVRRRGYSASHVTWGGNQNAPDGGIDVRVELATGSPIAGFVPRPATGFQVKKQDMPPGEIAQEMRPGGALRSTIRDLAEQGGAYIIVSSDGSTADSALINRREAMAKAVAGEPNASGLALDFYDRNRVATWVRNQETLIPWVRQTIGRPVPGWQSYGPWVAPTSADYLVDDKLRIHPGRKQTEEGLSSLRGIEAIRDQLREPRRAVRLVGLSGVGKTRLIQALFDERVAERSLNPSWAVYTNMSDGPEPQPVGLASHLIASGTRAVLVIDNCPAELHQRLSELCRRPDSQVSLISVEYDIRDDNPEGTDVFTMESSSVELIEKLLRDRFPKVSGVDVRTIAESSGGNARIAIALAATVEYQGTVANLTDEQLFRRLFVQRHEPNEDLYLAAQASSLVYSFQGDDISEGGELARLADIIESSAQELYRGLAELQRRDLVQQRGVWRATLPHAIANRLAAVALQNIPHVVIHERLVSGASERLLKSFSRRLGYLHASKEAVEIVMKWLEPNGLLPDVAHLNELGRALFENVTPVAPEAALTAMERAFSVSLDGEAMKAGEQYFELLRSLAYEPALFERSVELMANVLTAHEINEQSHDARLFASLFHARLSGTHATIQQRLGVIALLLGSEQPRRRELGLLTLRAVLEASHFFSQCRFDFGARSRDYGYWPRTKEDVRHWFKEGLIVAEQIACSDSPISPKVRDILAEKFLGMWRTGCLPDELARICSAIRKTRFWPEGWRAVRQTLDSDGKVMPPEQRDRLVKIEEELSPADLEQRVRSVVFNKRGDVDFGDYEDDGTDDIPARRDRAKTRAQDLGYAVARDEATLAALLRDIVSSDGRLWEFSAGLADGSPDAEELWSRLTHAFSATDEALRQPVVFRGFLHALYPKKSDLAARLLDQAVEHETLAPYYPFLQVAVTIGERDVARLKLSLTSCKAPVRAYVYLAYIGDNEPIPAGDLEELLLAMSAMPDGDDVALEILYMRLHKVVERKADVPPELIRVGRDLLRRFSLTNKNHLADYRVGEIATTCLGGNEGAAVVRELCAGLKDAIAKYATHAFYHDDLLLGFLKVQPAASLNGLCAGDAQELALGIRILDEASTRQDLLGVVTDEELIRWCEEDAAIRYPAIARAITVARRASETEPPRWTDRALHLLSKAPDAGELLRQFVDGFTPRSGWSGSLAAILEAHAPLLDDLHEFSNLADVIAEQRTKLKEAIEKQRQWETALDKQRDERFEQGERDPRLQNRGRGSSYPWVFNRKCVVISCADMLFPKILNLKSKPATPSRTIRSTG
jgi:hypothetical protein